MCTHPCTLHAHCTHTCELAAGERQNKNAGGERGDGALAESTREPPAFFPLLRAGEIPSTLEQQRGGCTGKCAHHCNGQMPADACRSSLSQVSFSHFPCNTYNNTTTPAARTSQILLVHFLLSLHSHFTFKPLSQSFLQIVTGRSEIKLSVFNHFSKSENGKPFDRSF